MREFGSEHPAVVLPDGYFDSLSSLVKDTVYLRSGREALMFAGINACNEINKTILLPSYCCWSMSAPFVKLGWSVKYYRLNEDLTVDISFLKQLLLSENPQAVLTMNFYGCASTIEAVDVVKAHDGKIQVIEDFSHCTFCLKNIFNEKVDFYVSSIRKSVGVCDGAVVLSNRICRRDCIQESETDFADKRHQAQKEKMRYAWTKDQNVKRHFLDVISECETIINDFKVVRPISKRSSRMLELLNGEEIAFARRENMKHLCSLLLGKVKMLPGVERSFLLESSAPFSLPILVDNRDDVQKTLAKRGVYTQLLWPICEEAQKLCPVSKMMNDRMLSVPIDQRYSWDDVEDIASIIISVCKC